MSKSAPAAEVIAGRYRVSGRIAAGGMGQVLRALDTVLGRTVAVKVLPFELASRPGFVERFRAEAQSAARLSHPNVVQVHDWGESGATYYMVMEYVRGSNLREILSVRRALVPRQACELMIQVLEALEAAHSRGLVHRDVKPENVMITIDGRVKVADFGLARALERATVTGGLLGTVAYVAPEQARGEQVDARADLYSAGCVLYELLTGSMPFEGDAAQVLYQHLNSRVPAPSDARPGIPADLDRIVLRATEPESKDRYPSAAEMRADIASSMSSLSETPPLSELAGELTAEVPAEILETMVPVERPKRRRRWPWLIAVLFTAAAVVAGWTFFPVKVPVIVGLDVAAARQRLAAAGLDSEVRRAFSDERPGTVISTEPGEGRRVIPGRTVVLTVSRGPAIAELIDLSGKTLDDAQKILGDAGFVLGEVTDKFDRTVKGTVIGQDPKPGKVRKGTPVNLIVSLGPEIVEVPAVTGKPFEEAKTLLGKSGLEASREDVFNDAASGTVVDQTPKAQEKVEKGSQVHLVVSKGPQPFAMPNVKGKTCSAAKAELESLELTVTINGKGGAACGANKVLDQDPLPGATVRKGQEATLYVA